jgi:EpsI family protein
MTGLRSSWRFICVLLIVGSTALFLEGHRRTEFIPKSEPMASFPMQVGEWSGRSIAIDPEALSVLGPGDFLNRVYFSRTAAPVSLFIGYFPSQRTGDTIHSPKNCLPGAGWVFAESGVETVPLSSGRDLRVGRYVIAKGADRQLVLYWYQAHGRAVVSEYAAKFYLVADSIRLNRTDGALVRVITSVVPGESTQDAERRVMSLVQQIAPMLPRYIPD